MNLKLISEFEVRKALYSWDAIIASKEAFIALHEKLAHVPRRTIIKTPNDTRTLFKPCHIDPFPSTSSEHGGLGLKVISIRPDNDNIGLPTTPAVIMLFNPVNGMPVGLMASTYLTAMRTGAGSALSTILCTNKDKSHVLTVFGAGLQAEAHIKNIINARDISCINIINRTRKRAEELASRLKKEIARMIEISSGFAPSEGVLKVATKFVPAFNIILTGDDIEMKATLEVSDIICTTTAASSPLFPGEWLKAGAHVIAVGSYRPETTEIDFSTVKRSKILVDTEEAFASGDLRIPLEQNVFNKERSFLGTLGKLLVNPKEVEQRKNKEADITLYKSVGCSAQDITTASIVLKACADQKIGFEYTLL